MCLYPSKIWWYPPLSQVETLCATPSTSWATPSARHSQGEATEDRGRQVVTQDGDLSGGVAPCNKKNKMIICFLTYLTSLNWWTWTSRCYFFAFKKHVPSGKLTVWPWKSPVLSGFTSLQPLYIWQGRTVHLLEARGFFTNTLEISPLKSSRNVAAQMVGGRWNLPTSRCVTFLGLGMGLGIYTQDLPSGKLT